MSESDGDWRYVRSPCPQCRRDVFLVCYEGCPVRINCGYCRMMAVVSDAPEDVETADDPFWIAVSKN